MRPALLLSGLALLFVLSPATSHADLLSPEFPIGTVELGPAGMLQSRAVAASDGLDFLVAWEDDREGLVTGRIRYTLLSREGDPLFAEGRPVPGSEQGYPVAAFWGGTSYIIFGTGAGGNGAVRIGRDGAIVQNEILVNIDGTVQAYASNGSSYLAVFTQASGQQSDVKVQLLDSGIRLIREVPLPTPPNGGEVIATAASDGDGYLVVWSSNRASGFQWDAYALRLSSDGVVLGTAVALGTFSGPVLPRAASNGDGYLVTLSESASAENVLVAVLDSAGQLLGGGAGLLAPGISTGVIAAQGQYLVPVYDSTFAASSDVQLYRLNPNASLASSSTLTTAEGNQSGVISALSSDRVLFVWNDGRRQRGEPIDLFFTFTSFGGTPLEGFNDTRGLPVTYSPPSQTSPSVAFDGTNYLAAWVESAEEGRPQLYAGRFTRSGESLDGRGIRLGSDESRAQFRPEVTFDGTNFVIVWREGAGFESRLLAVRVSPGGAILAPAPIDIAPILNVTSYSIASNGNGSAVLFSVLGPAAQEEIRFARISSEGAILDPGGRIAHIAQRTPMVAFASDGRDYLAVWSGQTAGTVFAQHISSAGAAGTVLVISGNGWDPVVAGGAGLYLVAYSSGEGIVGQLLNSGGAPQGGGERELASRAFTALDRRTRALAFDGLRFVLAWAYPATVLPPSDIGGPPVVVPDIRARVINRDGIPAGSADGIVIYASPRDESWPAVAGGGASAAIVYARIAPEASGIRRAFTRILFADPPRQRPARR